MREPQRSSNRSFPVYWRPGFRKKITCPKLVINLVTPAPWQPFRASPCLLFSLLHFLSSLLLYSESSGFSWFFMCILVFPAWGLDSIHLLLGIPTLAHSSGRLLSLPSHLCPNFTTHDICVFPHQCGTFVFEYGKETSLFTKCTSLKEGRDGATSGSSL